MTRSRTWTLGAVVLVVAILMAGWFLLVSPTRAEATSTEEATISQQQANAQLLIALEQLKVQAQDLPAQEAKLAELEQRIPTQPGLPSFIKSLSSISSKANVVLVSLEPQLPVPLVVPTTVQGVTPPPSTDDTSAPSSEVPPATEVPSTVQYVQSTVTIKGGYFNTEQFLTKLEGIKRSFLVTGFDVAPDVDPGAKSGDVVTHLQVRVFYSPPLVGAASGTLSTTATS